MLDAVRRFATKVLLLHLVLLGVVIFGVAVGTRQVYMGARKQAQEDSAARLRIIGQQTAAAIETQYQSIASDMEILLRSTSAATQASTQPGAATQAANGEGTTAPRQSVARGLATRGRGGRGGAAALFASMGGRPVNGQLVDDMWRQLQGRISQLFMVDNETGEVVQSLPAEKKETAEALTKAHLDEFRALKAPSMSAFAKTGNAEDSTGYNLLEIPTIRGLDVRFGGGGAGTQPGFGGRGDGTDVGGSENRGGGGRGFNGGFGRGRGGRFGGQGYGGRGGPGAFGGPEGGGPDAFAGPGGGPGGGPGPGGGAGGGGFPPPGGGDWRGPGPGGFGAGPGGGPGAEGGGPEGGAGPEGQAIGGPGGGGPSPDGQGMPPGASGGPGGGIGGNGGGNGAGGPFVQTGTVVAVVSLDKVRTDFFDPLNKPRPADVEEGSGVAAGPAGMGVVNAMLVDQKGDVLVSISGRWVGRNMLKDLDSGMRDAIAPYIQEGKAGSYVMLGDARLGNETLPARIIGFEPVELPSGQKWTVMTMSPVSEVDALVNRVFGSAFQWAVFVSVAVAGILFSSSVFLIRARVRLERAQHEVITKELQQARNIQLAWLPGENETPAGIDVSAVNLPASHISGDFYNWFALDGAGKGKVAVVIGDVTGHGMAAAFLMATTQLLVKVALQRTQDPGACLGIVNKQLCTQGFSGQFVTMIVVVLEPGSGAVEVATAGHPAPLLQRGGVFASMEVEPSLVLGVDAKETYKTHGFVAEPGATMILYTDGVVEAECEDGEQYGVERLVEGVNRGAAKTGGTGRPDQRIKTIVEDVRKFCGAKDLLDDLTVVAVRVG